eukprot:TRINITY_DN9361_c0_g2_i10.p1 TRINITY_DN9361_c0_g2~~TRINITY_DN9361_c0_g2_i10.p1  ORF type:complete len:202 (+),score=-8.29 TRINITY_DN9361_c0_g2_i10:179-784(+)
MEKIGMFSPLKYLILATITVDSIIFGDLKFIFVWGSQGSTFTIVKCYVIVLLSSSQHKHIILQQNHIICLFKLQTINHLFINLYYFKYKSSVELLFNEVIILPFTKNLQMYAYKCYSCKIKFRKVAFQLGIFVSQLFQKITIAENIKNNSNNNIKYQIVSELNTSHQQQNWNTGIATFNVQIKKQISTFQILTLAFQAYKS